MANDTKFETVTVSACKTCGKSFEVERPTPRTVTKDVQVTCTNRDCAKTHFYRKRSEIDASTDMRYVADIS